MGNQVGARGHAWTCDGCNLPVLAGEAHSCYRLSGGTTEKVKNGNTKSPTLSPHQIAAIAAATSRDRWAQIHAEIVRVDNVLCETYGFSRPGVVKGEFISVKALRQIVDKTA